MGFRDKMMDRMMGKMSSEDMMEQMGKMMGGKMDMMDKMMGDSGGGFNPMDMCQKMMSTISQSSEIATFATPEVRQLFEDWVGQVDEELLDLVKENKNITPEEIAEKLRISKSSAIYFLSRLAQKGKISINISQTD